MKEIIKYITKWGRFLLKNRCLSFRERLKIVLTINKDAKDSIIRRFTLNRLVVSENKESYFDIAGYKIFFRPDYKVCDTQYFMKGVTSVLIETFLLPEYFNSNCQIKEGDIVLDLGSCIGTTVLLFSKIVGKGGKVFAFEPVTYNSVRLNMEKNNISNVEIISKAVSDRIGKAEIEMSDYCLDSSMANREYTKGYYRHKKAIDITSLDAFAQEAMLSKVDFIKMDIEGMEELAIRGAANMIAKYRPKWSISSYHTDFNNEPQHDKLVKLLRDCGYRIEESRKHHIYAW